MSSQLAPTASALRPASQRRRRRLASMTLFSTVALITSGCATFAASTPTFSDMPSLTPNVATVIPSDGPAGGGAAAPHTSDGGENSAAPTSPAPADPCAPSELPVVAVCLDSPWGIAPLPSGDTALVGERTTGRILSVTAGQDPRTIATITDLDIRHGGGLLGLALSPYYVEDGLIYAYVTTASDARVVRLAANQEPKAVVTGLPVGGAALGGSLIFGPDGSLYIVTGNAAAGVASSAPQTSSEPGSTHAPRTSNAAPSTGAAPSTDTAPSTDAAPSTDTAQTTRAPESSGSVELPETDDASVLRVDGFGRPAADNSSGSALFARGFHDPTGACLLPTGGVGVLDHRVTGDVLIEVEDGGDYRTLTSGQSVWTYSPGGGGAIDCAVAGGQLLATARTKPLVTAIELRPQGGLTGAPESVLDGEFGLFRTAAPGPGDLTWLTTANRAGADQADSDEPMDRAKGSSTSDDRVVVLPPSSAGGAGGGVD